MFPDSLKYEAAFASTYKRGQKLFRDGHVGNWVADSFGDSATCSVEGTMLEGLLPGTANPLHIAARDVPVFCERLLPSIEAAGGFVAPASLADYVPPEAEFSFRIGSVDGNITCNATVSYDEAVLGLFDDLREGQPVRDINAELTRLWQLCCDPHLIYENYTDESAKLETCMELVAQAVEGGHKILLFSQFTSMLEIIAARLRKERVPYLVLTGATSKEQRVQLVREFQEGAVPVFLISLKAGGVGLNLTAADIVIHFDPWWNLAAQNQATDRAHRIGQTRDVSVFKIIAKNTIEEKVVKMQESKRDLAESIIGGEGVSSSTLTRDDVLALLDNALE